MAKFEGLPKLSELMASGMTEKEARQAYNRAYQKAIRQAQKAAKLAKDKKPPAPTRSPRPAKDAPVTVTLRLQHFRKGVSYGPGTVTVPQSLASDFLNTEQHARRMEEKFQGTRGCIIGPRVRGANKIIEVPVETFDDTLVSDRAPVADMVKTPGNNSGNQNQGGGGLF